MRPVTRQTFQYYKSIFWTKFGRKMRPLGSRLLSSTCNLCKTVADAHGKMVDGRIPRDLQMPQKTRNWLPEKMYKLSLPHRTPQEDARDTIPTCHLYLIKTKGMPTNPRALPLTKKNKKTRDVLISKSPYMDLSRFGDYTRKLQAKQECSANVLWEVG